MGSASTVVDALEYRGVKPQFLCRNDVGYLGTGGMLIKREVSNLIGVLDETYDPTCFEDTDISLKIRDYKKNILLSIFRSISFASSNY